MMNTTKTDRKFKTAMTRMRKAFDALDRDAFLKARGCAYRAANCVEDLGVALGMIEGFSVADLCERASAARRAENDRRIAELSRPIADAYDRELALMRARR